MGTIYSKLHYIQARLRANAKVDSNGLYDLIFKLASEQGCVLVFKEEVEELGKSAHKYNKAIVQLIDCETGDMIETHACSDDSLSARENCLNALFMLYDIDSIKNVDNVDEKHTVPQSGRTFLESAKQDTKKQSNSSVELSVFEQGASQNKKPPVASPTSSPTQTSFQKSKPAELNGKTWGRWAKAMAVKE